MKINTTYIALLLVLMTSCEFFQVKNTESASEELKQPIARAHTAYLYLEDIEGIAPKGMSPEDSASRVLRYIDTWAKKQLLIKEAAENIDFDEADIERKILDYRYSLMGYEYQSFYINKHLNKSVTNEEISAYYEEHIDNFILKENIIRGKFVNLPNEAPPTENIRKLIASTDEDDIDKLNAYCLSYAVTYQLNDSIWMNLAEIVKGTPWKDVQDKTQEFLNAQYLESKDSLNSYHILVTEFKTSGEIAPVQFVHNQIKDILINKRKIELAKELEQQVYDNAKKNNEIEIY